MNISVNQVEKTYTLGKAKVHALKGVNLEITRGDFLCIKGASGCGKTTLLNIIGCIDSATKGEILFNGENIVQYDENQQSDLRLNSIGFIFQSFNLIPVLDIRENIEFPLIAAGVEKSKRKQRVEELINKVGLEEYKNHKPDELSGGQRQRVAIARALVNAPDIVIADEPTANLDSETSELILKEMRRLNQEENVTFIFSTHDEEIVKYAKRIAYIKDGIITKIEEA